MLLLVKDMFNITHLKSVFKWLYRKLLPPTCVFCGRSTHNTTNICILCRQSLPILPYSCLQCAQILHSSTDKSICGACLKNPPPFNRTFALFPYQLPIVSVIKQLKFHGQLNCAQALGELLTEQAKYSWYVNETLPDLIIPVPLHFKRLQERGFNQALEIVRVAGKKLDIPIDIKGIKRCKATQAQSTLSASERKKNMTNAFKVSKDYTGLSIAVIDDVITTGHTINELCKALKRKGAKHIDVWCCARNI